MHTESVGMQTHYTLRCVITMYTTSPPHNTNASYSVLCLKGTTSQPAHIPPAASLHQVGTPYLAIHSDQLCTLHMHTYLNGPARSHGSLQRVVSVLNVGRCCRYNERPTSAGNHCSAHTQCRLEVWVNVPVGEGWFE